ncbi:hypothetical protein J7E62_30440 [Variovorax paradoxus]|nr:hypothetical protein [Variovorax paradoxus]
MISITAALTKEDNFPFHQDNTAPREASGILYAVRRRLRRTWLRLSWRAQTLTFGLMMIVTSFGLSMLVAFLGSL